jgi:hypothetical protein
LHALGYALALCQEPYPMNAKGDAFRHRMVPTTKRTLLLQEGAGIQNTQTLFPGKEPIQDQGSMIPHNKQGKMRQKLYKNHSLMIPSTFGLRTHKKEEETQWQQTYES